LKHLKSLQTKNILKSIIHKTKMLRK